MPEMRVLIATRGDRRTAIARALGIHAPRPCVEVGGADDIAGLFDELAARAWHALILDEVFAGAASSELLIAASEFLRETRVFVLGNADSKGPFEAIAPDDLATLSTRVLGPIPAPGPAAGRPRIDLPRCATLDELLALGGRRPRSGLLSLVMVQAPDRAAPLLARSLREGGFACRWTPGTFAVLRRAASEGEAVVWAHGVLADLPDAALGVAWSAAQNLGETTVNQAERALDLAKSRGGRVATWPTVRALEHARRIAPTAPCALHRRRALLDALLASMGDAQREHTTVHSELVAATALDLARLLRLSGADCDRVHLAGLLHDIGKIAIPDDLLAEPGPLSPLQRRVMDTHAAEGAHLCDALGVEPAVGRMVLHHHTRFDSPVQAPEGARIVAVADAVVTMTSTRSYSPARTYTHALSELRRCRGTMFDPRIVVAAHIIGASSMRAAA